VKPSLAFNLTIAIIVGFMLGVVTALIRELMDNTLKGEEDTLSYLGLPVLGSVQKMKPRRSFKKRKIKQTVRGRAVES